MAVYAVGDIHGCFDTFQNLLARIRFNPRADTLWLVGDVVNRGPQSLAVLRWLKQNKDAAVCVLGNHDLHLLALTHGVGAREKHPSLAAIWEAKDGEDLCRWLQQQPLAHYGSESDTLLVHAGVLPQWNVQDVLTAAREVETQLRKYAGAPTAASHAFFTAMYGNTPAMWDDALTPPDRWRVSINALTRMRICTRAGAMELTYTGPPDAAPDGYCAWFAAPARATANTRVIFGHWSTLGIIQRENLLALDSGCLWGGALSAVCLDNGELFQVPCAAGERQDIHCY